MYDRLKKLIDDLDAKKNNPFIGYGNPNASILIVGQECTAAAESVDYATFYEPNFFHWKNSFLGHGFVYTNGNQPYTYEHGNFHPINPFYRLLNKKQSKKKEIGRPSPTYYYYQRLIDKINDCDKSMYINFFEHCFITELNDVCFPNHKGLKKEQHKMIKERIEKRFDWMRATNFFNQFKVVILACGRYADAIKKDETLRKDLFGNSLIVYCHQLSYWDKSLEERIPEIQDILRE